MFSEALKIPKRKTPKLETNELKFSTHLPSANFQKFSQTKQVELVSKISETQWTNG